METDIPPYSVIVVLAVWAAVAGARVQGGGLKLRGQRGR